MYTYHEWHTVNILNINNYICNNFSFIQLLCLPIHSSFLLPACEFALVMAHEWIDLNNMKVYKTVLNSLPDSEIK